jgi:hypothetical protein
MSQSKRGETIALTCEMGVDISWEIKDGALEITSNMSEEDTKAIVPMIWPAWMLKE